MRWIMSVILSIRCCGGNRNESKSTTDSIFSLSLFISFLETENVRLSIWVWIRRFIGIISEKSPLCQVNEKRICDGND